MSVFLSILEEEGEAIISDQMIGPVLYGNAPIPRASDGHMVYDRPYETKEAAQKYVNGAFPNLKIINRTTPSGLTTL